MPRTTRTRPEHATDATLSDPSRVPSVPPRPQPSDVATPSFADELLNAVRDDDGQTDPAGRAVYHDGRFHPIDPADPDRFTLDGRPRPKRRHPADPRPLDLPGQIRMF